VDIPSGPGPIRLATLIADKGWRLHIGGSAQASIASTYGESELFQIAGFINDTNPDLKAGTLASTAVTDGGAVPIVNGTMLNSGMVLPFQDGDVVRITDDQAYILQWRSSYKARWSNGTTVTIGNSFTSSKTSGADLSAELFRVSFVGDAADAVVRLQLLNNASMFYRNDTNCTTCQYQGGSVLLADAAPHDLQFELVPCAVTGGEWGTLTSAWIMMVDALDGAPFPGQAKAALHNPRDKPDIDDPLEMEFMGPGGQSIRLPEPAVGWITVQALNGTQTRGTGQPWFATFTVAGADEVAMALSKHG